KAATKVKVEFSQDIEWFYAYHEHCLKKRNLKISYSKSLLRRIWQATQNINSSCILKAADANGNVHSALLVVWDKESAYHLITPLDPDFLNSQSLTLCVAEAIKFLSGKTKRYDFEGSMIPNIERSYRSFGTMQMQYFS